jgi:hypothetical protein
MATAKDVIRIILMVIVGCGFVVAEGLAADKSSAGEVTENLSPLSAPLRGMTGDELFRKVLEHNRRREARLQQYWPDHKTFVTESEKGSTLVRDLVLKRLIESESETSTGRSHRDSSIGPANYEFNLLGEQDVGLYHCVVAEAHPRRPDKYLFEGKIWIDAEDYAIVRIAGHPARSLSFWITRADFVRQYQKLGEFWLPARDKTFVHMRLYGNKVLTIDHRDYTIKRSTGGSPQDLTTQNQSTEPVMALLCKNGRGA